ncbi:MAG TPA: hypothetical protein IAD49_01110 [Candidatus Fimihabitans intestinipullorum]|uniref:Uncharacterized protein n=1 Tax=Candidatus Fimihabitans intestinipullorum TaxID=2840820 RepID=A0A9D1HV21_9BACT|nr:hypothetical protein [Candidatus Fimihabitans intestinipullorum]
MDKENTKTITRKRLIGSNYVEELEYYDFNLYPLHLIEPGYQLFVVPTDTINEACYIVRKGDFSASRVSHADYARELVRSEPFAMQEELDYQRSNGTTARWKDYQKEYFNNELEYLIEKKGFILFSPPQIAKNVSATMPPVFIPDMDLLTTQEIHNFFYLLDINPNLHIDKEIQDKLLAKITTKNKSR